MKNQSVKFFRKQTKRSGLLPDTRWLEDADRQMGGLLLEKVKLEEDGKLQLEDEGTQAAPRAILTSPQPSTRTSPAVKCADE